MPMSESPPLPAGPAPCQTGGVGHLLELGYRDRTEERAQAAVDRAAWQARIAVVKQAAATGDAESTRAAVDALLQERPDDAEANLLAAKLDYAAGDYARALTHLDALAYRGIEAPQVVYLRGAALLATRQMQAAVDQLQYASYVGRSLPEAHGSLGWAYLRIGQIASATDAFRRSLELAPESSGPRLGQAAACCRLGDYEQAAGLALDVVEQNPRDWRAHYRLGAALVGLGHGAEAVNAFDAALRLNGRLLAPLRWLARQAPVPPQAKQTYAVEARNRIAARRESRSASARPDQK